MNPTQDWLQLTIAAGFFNPEQLEDALLAVGALAVTYQDGGDQPVLEPAPGTTPLWSNVRVTGLFAAGGDRVRIAEQLRRILDESIALNWDTLEDREWTRAWLDDYHPMRFGNRLWVCPHGHQVADADAVIVHLDPGLAFGTGTHPSTALCLSWLDGADLVGKRVVDYGCGSGILAIAAAKLGADRVYAVDIDPQALQASTDNAMANGVADRIAVSPPETLLDRSADVVIANILANPLIELAPRLTALLDTPGWIVLAGLLSHQAQSVRTAFTPRFTFAEPGQREDWVLLHGTRRG